ncbi:MAG: hypothetical protein OJF49_000663 [Ktedonobacterales bacterium]|nr:MAG: hypothetical protein OJF49_000663 [Ktedonobacterales bacterium]
MLEDIHIGVPVDGGDGHRLGTLKRIVVATGDTRVTHVVVDPGLIESGNALAPGGWEKPRERLVPVSLITSANDQHAQLSCDEAAFLALSLFEHEHFVETEITPSSPHRRFRFGDLINYIASVAGGAPVQAPESVSYSEKPGAAEIGEGTAVWRKEPHDEIGEVERVLFDSDTQRVSALVMRRKGVFGRSLVLPISEVADIQDGVVHITLDDAALDALQPYEKASE